MSAKDIFLNWMIFLGKCLLLIAAVVVLVLLFRRLSILIKRCIAARRIEKVAKTSGYEVERKRFKFLSISKRKAPTAYILTKGNRKIHVHFIATEGKARILRFFASDAYAVEKTVGFFALNTQNAFSLSTAKMFKPKNMSGSTLQWAHADGADLPLGTIRLRGMEEQNQACEAENVIILNPAPMKAFYLAANSWQPIIEGETIFGIGYHTVESFCSTLKRG